MAEVDLRRGEWERAVEAARGVAPLDPRSTLPLLVEGWALMHTRRFNEALALTERGLALDPSAPEWSDMRIEISRGARRLGWRTAGAGLRRAPARICPGSRVPREAVRAEWVLPDSARAFLLRQRPDVMEGDTADWGLALAIAARSLETRAPDQGLCRHGAALARGARARREPGQAIGSLAYWALPGLRAEPGRAKHTDHARRSLSGPAPM